MIKGKILDDKYSQLRRKAEAIRNLDPENKEDKESYYGHLLNELETYAIELELQHQELQQTHAALAQTHEKLLETHQRHYELSPIAYITQDEAGLIIEANLTMANWLGLSKTRLLHSRLSDYIVDEDQDIFYLFRNKILQTRQNQSCELRVNHSSGSVLWLRIEGNINQQHLQTVYYLSFNDISAYKQLQHETQHYYQYIESIFRIAPVGIGLVNNRVIREVNTRICEMTGYSREELIDKDARFLYLNEEDYHFVGDEKYRQIQKTGTGSVIIRWQCKDGHSIDIVLSSTPIDINNIDQGVVFTALDISELLKTKNHLQKEKDKYLDLYDKSPDMYINLDQETATIIDCNQRLIDILGYSKTELIGEQVFALYTRESAAYVKKELFPQFKKTGAIVNEALQILKKDGSILDVSLNASAIRDREGKIIGSRSVWRDISEKKQLHASLVRYKDYFEYAPQPYQALDRNGILLETNAAWRKMLGYENMDLQDIWFGNLLIAAEKISFNDKLKALLDLDEIHDMQCTLQHKEGYPILVHIDGTIIRDSQGQLIQAQCILTNITEKRKLDAQLKLFRQQIDQSKDAFYVIDYASSQFLDANQTACHMLGFSRQELLSKSFINSSCFFNSQTQWQKLAAETKNHTRGHIIEDEHIHKDRYHIAVEVSMVYQISNGREILVAGVRDISQRKLAEKQQRQHQENYERMVNLEIINQTVAAIAHELNQPLNGSALYSDAARHLLQAENLNLEKINYALEQNCEQIQKAGKVTHELFRFMRSGHFITGLLDLDKAINKVIQIVTEDGESAHYRIIYKPARDHLPKVRANTIQIEKVLLNIIRNAITAMTESAVKDGKIIIAAQAYHQPDYVQITIEDNGPGIDDETAAKLFEPFTTSKRDGLGIGLAISRSMIEALGGQLWYQPKALSDQCGATFQLTLPCKTN